MPQPNMKMSELQRRVSTPLFPSMLLCVLLTCGCSASRQAERARVSADSTIVSRSALLGLLRADSLSLDFDIVIDSPELIRQLSPMAVTMPLVRARSMRVHATGQRASVTAARTAILIDSAAVSRSASASATTTTAHAGGFRTFLTLILAALVAVFIIKNIIQLYRFFANKS